MEFLNITKVMNFVSNLKVVFLVGCPRSGATMIGTVLGAHRNAYLIDDPDDVYQWTDAVFSGKPAVETNDILRECCRKARRN